LIACLFAQPILLLAADSGISGAFSQVIFIFAPVFAIWYFLVIAPQSKQRKKTQEMLENLQSGDRVVTTGGIYGTIAGFGDGKVQLQIASQVKIDVARSAITGLAADEDTSNKQDAPAKGKK
jgi:preprotein translocase subunit YajC